MSFLPRKKIAWVGLSLYPEQISLLKMRKVKRELMIEQFNHVQLPLQLISEGKIHQPEQVTAIIQNLVRDAAAENCLTGISFPISQVIQKRIKLAAFLRDEECMAEIDTNLMEYFPGIDEPLNFDCMQRPASANEIEGVLVAARTEQINAYKQPIELAGLDVRLIDVDVYALVRAVNFMYGISNQLTVLFDTTAAQLVILRKGEIIFSQQIMFDSAETLAFNLRRTLQVMATTIPIAEIKKGYVSGNLTWFRVIESILLELLAVTVEVVSPFTAVRSVVPTEYSLEQSAAALTALGLALRSVPQW